MRKHKIRRKRRQNGETTYLVPFNPIFLSRCRAQACRRARKCLGRAKFCGCTRGDTEIDSRSDDDNIKRIRQAINALEARDKRREDKGLPPRVPENPAWDDADLDPWKEAQIFKEELQRHFKEHGID